MRKKNKTFSAFLITALLVLAGCGSSGGNEPAKPDDAGNKPAKEEKVTVEETVLLDEGGIKITATGFDEKGFWGPELKLLLENNTENNIIVSTDALIVNNYMVSDLFSENVAAGKKSNVSMQVFSSALEKAGITKIGQIEIDFHILNETYDRILDPAPVTLKTSVYDSMDTKPNDVGTELYNKDGIRIVGKYTDKNSFWGTAIVVYIENKTGRNVMISSEDLSVNGFMVSGGLYSTVYDGKMIIDEIEIMDSSLKENNITDIQKVELSFHIIDNDTWDTIADTGSITIQAGE